MRPVFLLIVLLFATAAVVTGEQTGAEILTGKKTGPSSSPWVADPQTVMLFEMAVAALVVAFVVVFILGSHRNLTIARSVADSLMDMLSEQFVQLGAEDGKKLVKDGQSYYWFYATGRRHTTGLTVLMDLSKRMDIFSYTSSFMSTPQRDRIVFHLPMTANVAMDPMSLFIVRKKELSRLREIEEGAALEGVEALAAQVVDVNGFPADLVTMTEHSDIITALLPERVRTIIANNARHIISIHVTDQGAKWEAQCRLSKKLVRVEFTLPFTSSQREEVLHDMSQVALHLLDAAADAKISTAAKKKAVELRRQAAIEVERKLQKNRAEAAAARRQEKKKQEEEAVAKMSREKQIKYEEKKRKKEVTSRMRKAVRK